MQPVKTLNRLLLLEQSESGSALFAQVHLSKNRVIRLRLFLLVSCTCSSCFVIYLFRTVNVIQNRTKFLLLLLELKTGLFNTAFISDLGSHDESSLSGQRTYFLLFFHYICYFVKSPLFSGMCAMKSFDKPLLLCRIILTNWPISVSTLPLVSATLDDGMLSEIC